MRRPLPWHAALLGGAAVAATAGACVFVDVDECLIDGTCGPMTDASVDAETAANANDAGVDVTLPKGFDLVQTGSSYVATSRASPNLGVEIDCDDDKVDGRVQGIVPVIDGTKLAIPLYGAASKFAFITPYFAAGAMQCKTVTTDAAELVVRFEVGSFNTWFDAGSDEPVPLDARFRVENGRLVASLDGIYFLMPTRKSTTLTIVNETTTTRMVTSSSPQFTEYYDKVTHIGVQDSLFGHYEVELFAERLQVQLYDDGSEGFELDFGSSFHDFGQKSVNATITFR